MLDQENQLHGFKALCGLGEHKPFECVGSVAESRAVMKCLANDSQWQDKYIVRKLAEYTEINQAGELELQPDFEATHNIPAAVMARLNAS